MEDKLLLAKNTNLTVGECEILLRDRTLSGNPEEHSHPAVFITEDEVIVETESVFNSSDAYSSIKLAFESGAKVSNVRRDSLSGDYHLNDPDEE